MSSHASTKDTATEPGQALVMERKKTKVLKSALKQERKDRAAQDAELEKAKAQIEELNN